jgi:DNA invertase Pin-like site-specific DNA recombinase
MLWKCNIRKFHLRQSLAKRAGVYMGGKPSLTLVQVAEIRKRIKAGEKKARLATEYRVSRQTLHSALG